MKIQLYQGEFVKYVNIYTNSKMIQGRRVY